MQYYGGMPLIEQLWGKLSDSERETIEAFTHALIHRDMKEIESYKDGGLGWSPKIGTQFDIATFYRIKPKPKFVPFTIDDAEMFLNKIIKPKDGKDKFRGVIVGANSSGIAISTHGIRTYKDLFDNMLFLNNEPCGKINK